MIRSTRAVALASSLALLAGSTPAFAQGSSGNSTTGVPAGYQVTGPGNFGQFTGCAAGDFDDDGYPDALIVRNGKLETVGRPVSYGWWISHTDQVNDVRTMPRQGIPQDYAIAVGAAGLFRIEDINDAQPTPLKTTTLEDADWVDAKFVDSVDAGETQPRIYGVMDNDSIRRLRDTGGGYMDTPVTLSPAPSGAIKALEVAEVVSASPGAELLICTLDSLYIYAANGAGLGVFFEPNDRFTGLTTGRHGTGTYVAWTTHVGFGPARRDYVRYGDSSGISAPVEISHKKPMINVSSVDWNGDFNSDLVFAFETLDELQVAENIGTTSASFDLINNLTSIPFSSIPGSFNQTGPCIADFDQDGDQDILFPVQSTGSLLLERNATQDHEDFQVLMNGLNPQASNANVNPDYDVDGCDTQATNQIARLQFEISLPPVSVIPNEADLVINVFRKESETINTEATPVEDISLNVGDLRAMSPSMVDIDLPDMDLIVPQNCSGTKQDVGYENFYFLESMFVITSGGTTTNVFPPKIWALQNEHWTSGQPNGDYLLSLGTDGLYITSEYKASQTASKENVGTINSIPCIPDLPLDTPVNP